MMNAKVIGLVSAFAAACTPAMAPRVEMRADEARVRAVYVCDPDALLVVESRGERTVYVASQGWQASNHWSDADGEHYVQFALKPDDAPVIIEYLIPADHRADALVREYQRSRGARYKVVRRGEVWGVVGTPSTTAACRVRWREDATPRTAAR